MKKLFLFLAVFVFFLFIPVVSWAHEGHDEEDFSLGGGKSKNLQHLREDEMKKREEVKSRLGNKREELKKDAHGKSKEVKARIEARRQEKIKEAYQKLTEKVNKILARFEELITKIESRLDKLSETQDVSSIQAKAESAKDKIAQAKADIASLEGVGSDVASSTDPKSSFATTRQMFQDVKKELDEAHKILVSVIGDVKGIGDREKEK